MLTIILKSIKLRRISITIFVLVAFFYTILIGSFFPTIQKNAEQFNKLMEYYPESLLAFLGGDILQFSTFEGFLSLEYLNFFWVFIAGGLALAFATAAIAQENENGTLELMLWQPISRTKYLFAKIVTLILLMLIMTVVTVLGAFISASSIDVSISHSAFWIWAVDGFLLLLAFSGISFLLSVIFNERGRANMIAISVLIVSYILNGLAEIIDKIKDFQFLSLFHYYNSQEILKTGEWPIKSIIIFFSVFIICVILSVIIFRKKNIAV